MFVASALVLFTAAVVVALFIPPIPLMGGTTSDCVQTPQICDKRVGLRVGIGAVGLVLAAVIAAFGFWDPNPRRPRA